MRILLLSLCAVMLMSCAKNDALSVMSPEGMKDGFAAEVAVLARHERPVPSTSTTVTITTTSTTSTTTTTTTVQNVFYENVERWRQLVTEAVFAWGGTPSDVHRFLRIMQCESSGLPNAKNPNSSASGLMQHLTRYWDDRAERAGLPGADVFNPAANIWVSAWLALAAPEGGWQHWVCK